MPERFNDTKRHRLEAASEGPEFMSRVETQDLQALKKLRALAEVGWLSEQPADFQALIASAGRWTTFPRQALL